MKQISNILPAFVILFIFTFTGCSRKSYPIAEYHQLTGRNAKPYTKQGNKTVDNTLLLSKKYRFTLSPKDSVFVYQQYETKILSNYKEFFIDVVPEKNYKITVHSLPDTHITRNKYLFKPYTLIFDKENKIIKVTSAKDEFTGMREEPGLKRTITFNSGNAEQAAIVLFSDNNELDKEIYTFTLNFVTFKYKTATTGDFHITIEEIKE